MSERELVLQRYYQKYNTMSNNLRNLPTYHFQDPVTMQSVILSLTQVIQEIEANTALGQMIVQAEMSKIGRIR